MRIAHLRTNLLRRSAFAAACEADEHVKFHVQYSLAVAKAAALAVNCGESALDQNVILTDGKNNAQAVFALIQRLIRKSSYQDSAHVFGMTIVVPDVKPIHPHLLVGDDVIIQYAIFLLTSAFVTAYVSARSA